MKILPNKTIVAPNEASYPNVHGKIEELGEDFYIYSNPYYMKTDFLQYIQKRKSALLLWTNNNRADFL
ncbi:hypothetical protein [Paenisporosarcina indica]|uniref:hypothetical protein n=1 Tax=Paenisporosarcina indica TaxID=650093 RepID=UPI00137295E8|nr:hypothetical protein [Paenisporosarcina indica]